MEINIKTLQLPCGCIVTVDGGLLRPCKAIEPEHMQLQLLSHDFAAARQTGDTRARLSKNIKHHIAHQRRLETQARKKAARRLNA